MKAIPLSTARAKAPACLMAIGLVLALVVALVLAPVASAQHCGPATGVDCAIEHVDAHEDGEDHAGHAGDHAHGCGGCHAHMMGCELERGASGAACAQLVPARLADPVASQPDGLFRPPRA